MMVVLQRVSEASVTIEGQKKAEIGLVLLILVGIEDADSTEDITWLVPKIAKLRMFPDKEGVMNLSVQDTGGEIIIVSQFTLHAVTKKGNRPSYIKASKPSVAIPLYEAFIKQIETDLNKPVPTGVFGADMKVNLINDGPVTILVDSKNKDL